MPPRYEYGTQYRASFGGAFTPAVKLLIIINVAVYVIEMFLRSAAGPDAWDLALTWFALNPVLVLKSFFVWQLVTYQFMHSLSSIFHLLFNMLMLWMLGCEIERVWGATKFVRYYLVCGIGAGVLNCAFAFGSQTIGASGAVFGLLVAYGVLFPTRTILFWGIFPMSARQLVILLALIELFSLGAFGQDGVARFAHLGGALTGYLLIKGVWNPRRFYDEVRWKLRRRRFKKIEREDSRRSDRDRFYPFH